MKCFLYMWHDGLAWECQLWWWVRYPGQMSWSRLLTEVRKWTNGQMSQTITLTDIIPGTKVQYKKRHLMTKAYLTLTLRSQLKVEGHRRGGVCVLWMVLFFFFFFFFCISMHFQSIFFSNSFVNAKNACTSKASKMLAQSAKPEGAKQPRLRVQHLKPKGAK